MASFSTLYQTSALTGCHRLKLNEFNITLDLWFADISEILETLYIHRNSIVNIKQIKESKKTVTGRLQLSFKNNSDKLTISRKYIHLFKTL